MSLYSRNPAPGLYSATTGKLERPWPSSGGLNGGGLGGSGFGGGLGGSGLGGGSLRGGGLSGGGGGFQESHFEPSGFQQPRSQQSPFEHSPFETRIFPPKGDAPSPFNTREIQESHFHPRFEMPAYQERQRALAEEENRQRAAIMVHRLRQRQHQEKLAFQEQFSYKNRKGRTPYFVPWGPDNPKPSYIP